MNRHRQTPAPQQKATTVKRATLTIAAIAITGLVAFAPTADSAGAEGTWCGDRSDVAIVGSSSATGYMTTGYTRTDGQYQKTRYGWYSQVLHDLWAEYGTVGENHARSGAFASDYAVDGRWAVTRDATSKIAVQGPDLVFVQLGGPEYLNQIPPAVFETELSRVITDIRDAAPHVDIILLKNQRVSLDQPTYPWSAYGAAMGRVAATQGTAMIDLQQHVDSSGYDSAHLWASDDTHLNDSGNSVVAAAVWGWLAASC